MDEARKRLQRYRSDQRRKRRSLEKEVEEEWEEEENVIRYNSVSFTSNHNFSH